MRSGRVHFLDEAPHRAYIDLCRKQSLVAAAASDEDFKVVFTPLHGVGAMTAMEALVGQGFRVMPVGGADDAGRPVPQRHQDAQSRSARVDGPGRGRRGAEHQADLVLATDPDADRLGAMIPGSAPAAGTSSPATRSPLC